MNNGRFSAYNAHVLPAQALGEAILARFLPLLITIKG